MLYRSARISAVSPSGMLHWLGISGFTMRQPRVVECMVSWVLGYALDGLRTTQGARLIDSTPPARMSSASPVSIARLAWITASSPEPHNRFTVEPGTEVGKPARMAAIRSTLRLSSPAALASPRITSSTREGSSFGWRATIWGKNVGREIVRSHLAQCLAVAAERRAHGIVDEAGGHAIPELLCTQSELLFEIPYHRGPPSSAPGCARKYPWVCERTATWPGRQASRLR